MTILIFLAVLFVLILVHELGHFAVAKWTGMRVDEFGIGFPPKLFSIRKGETAYSLNLLPIGGFVKIFGENYDEDGIRDPRAFTSKHRLAQAAVLIAGIAMNILFAWLLIAAVLITGVTTAVDAGSAGDDASLIVAGVLPEGPVSRAGVPLGAEITEVRAGDEVLLEYTPAAFASFTRTHGDDDITIAYEHKGESTSATVRPETGVIKGNEDQAAVGVEVSLVETVRYPLHVALMEAAKTTWGMLAAITVGIVTLIADALSLSADLSQVAGPVGIVNMVGDAADFGFSSLLLFSALISLNLAIVNLLPVPALDGGRLLFVAIETVIRRPLNPVWAGRANLVGFALLMLLMVVVTVSDVLKLT